MDHRLDSSLQPHGVLQHVWKQGDVSTTLETQTLLSSEFMHIFTQRPNFPLCAGPWMLACRLQSCGEPVRHEIRAPRWKDLTFFFFLPTPDASTFVFTVATRGNLYDFLSLSCFPSLRFPCAWLSPRGESDSSSCVPWRAARRRHVLDPDRALSAEDV